jgi:hypothetical protein
MRVAASKVRITRRYLVDCAVCEELVTAEGADTSYGYPTKAAAAAVKAQHLEQHAAGEI